MVLDEIICKELSSNDLERIEGGFIFGFGPGWAGVRIWNKDALFNSFYGETYA